MMPEMDGFTVIKHLKEIPSTSDIPVIFVTAMEDTSNETHGLELGAVDYITKPIIPVIVKARVKNHLELKRHRDFFRRLSTLDGLTGIANRRHFDESLLREWNLSLQTKIPISLLLIDIDFFKQYNDFYGHLAGDKCLRTLASNLEDSVSDINALVARYGGEEFVILLPGLKLEAAQAIAQKCIDNIAQMNIKHEASTVSDKVTISIGAASVFADPDLNTDSIIRDADNKLYQAKEQGRNKIVY